jgi:hypothetical protein
MTDDGITDEGITLRQFSETIGLCCDPDCADHRECLTLSGPTRPDCWCHNCIQRRFLGDRP